jgi:spore germination protein KB
VPATSPEIFSAKLGHNIHMEKSITTLQLYMLLYLSTGFMNHVLIEPVLFGKVGRDAWISAILAFVLLLLMVPFVYYIMNNLDNLSLFDWLKQNVGQRFTIVIYVPVIIYLIFMSAITLKDTTDWLNISYLPQTPEIISVILVVLLCVFVALSGIRTLAILTGILLPFVVIFGYFVMTANFQFKNYSLLLPIMEHGFKPVFNGTFYAWGGLVEIILLLWLRHHLDASKVKVWSLLLFSLLLVGLTIGPLTGALAEFGPVETAKMRYPAYEQWRLVQVGKYIAHLDFLSLYQWMSGTIIRISLALFLVLDIVGLNQKRSNVILISVISVCLIIFVELPLSDNFFILMLSRFYLPASVIFSVVYLLVISVLMFVKRRH